MRRMREFLFSIVKKQTYQDLKLSRVAKNITVSDMERGDKLASLLHHAKINSEYYKNVLIKDIENTKLSDLPILTKQLIEEHQDEILSTSTNDLKFAIKNSTSGSTGKASYFYSDLRDGRTARAYRGDEFVPGYHFLDKQLVFWGAERDIIQSLSLKKLAHRFLFQTEIFSTYHLQESDIKNYIGFINSYKPKTIVGYPSALFFIAKVIKEKSFKLVHQPNGIITSGEMLYPHQREMIEETFETKIFNRYGCREFGHIANECEAHSGYHYDADSLIVEVVDDNGKPCEVGEEGRILITDLNNYAFPMIRYEIGDRGALTPENEVCKCGSHLPKLQTITGRAFDVIHGTNGNRVSGTYWTLSFRNTLKGIDAFQIRQDKDYSINFFLKVNQRYTVDQDKQLRSLVGEKLGDNKISIKVVDEFEYSPTGKFKWIHSELNK